MYLYTYIYIYTHMFFYMWVHVQTNPYISIFGFCMSIYIHSYIVLHIYIYMHRQSHTYIPSNHIVLYIYYILMSWFVFLPPYTLMVSMMVGQSPRKKKQGKIFQWGRNTLTISRLYLDYLPVVIGYPLVMSNSLRT